MVLCLLLASFLGPLAKSTTKTPDVFLASLARAFRALLESRPPAGPPIMALMGVPPAMSWFSTCTAVDCAIFYRISHRRVLFHHSFLQIL